jgi:hypothetical protein
MPHNNQIKKEAVCYTPACEWPAAIFSQACAPQTAPIITGVMQQNQNSELTSRQGQSEGKGLN